MKKCLFIASVAGLAAVASAQTQDLQVVGGSQTPGIMVGSGAYGSRVSDLWANGVFAGPNLGFFGALYDGLDDVDFTGGPWDSASPSGSGRVITQMSFGIGQFAGATPTAPQTGDIHFDFYDAAAVDALTAPGTAGSAWTNTTDILAGSLPFTTYSFTFTSTGTGIYSYFTNGTAIALPNGGNRFYIRWYITNAGTATIWTGAASAYVLGFANNQLAGTATKDVGFNTTAINTAPPYTGSPTARCTGGVQCAPTTGCAAVATDPGWIAVSEHRHICNSGAANGNGFFMTLRGEIVVADPPGTDTTLGCLADGNTQKTVALGAGETKFYKFCLPGDATDTAGPTGDGQFIDIDTEGGDDASIGLYTSGDGSLLDSDAADGSGEAALLTYGIGRRNAIGDGTQYDGRDGTLLARDYIVGIAAGNANFASLYAVSGAAGPASCKLNFHTNTNGAALAASVPPAVENTAFDLGDISQITTAPPAADMDPNWVVWYKFQVCSDVADDGDAGAVGSYLDFDFSGSFANSDPEVYMFDGNPSSLNYGGVLPPPGGNADDEGPGFFPQFSYGDVAPARPAVGDGIPFAGDNGTLAAGTYYMVVGLFDVVPSNSARFHARSTSGSSLPAGFVPFLNGITQCSTCAPCAADYNQDGGVDGSDVGAFFPDWEASAPCADVNLDGGIDGPDVEFFFLKWEAGDPTCSG